MPGAVLGTAGITAIVYGLIQAGEDGWTAPVILAAFAIGTTLLVAFVRVEARAQHPMLPLHFFTQRDFTGGVAILGLLFFAGIVSFFFLTQFFQIVQGRSAFEAGLLILPNAAGIAIATGIATVAVKTLGPRRMLLIAMTVMAVAMGLFTRFDADTSSISIALTITMFGFGWGLGAAPLTDTVMAAVPVEDAGIGSAVNDVSRELGSALGIALIGSFVSGLYRSSVSNNLDGQVPEDIVHVARGRDRTARNDRARARPSNSTDRDRGRHRRLRRLDDRRVLDVDRVHRRRPGARGLAPTRQDAHSPGDSGNRGTLDSRTYESGARTSPGAGRRGFAGTPDHLRRHRTRTGHRSLTGTRSTLDARPGMDARASGRVSTHRRW